MSDLVLGLDLGSYEIKAVLGEVVQGAFKVLGVGRAQSRGLQSGKITGMDSVVRSINEALEAVAAMAGSDPREASVAVGLVSPRMATNDLDASVILKQGKKVSNAEVERLINHVRGSAQFSAGYRVVHVHPNQFILDDNRGIRNPVGLHGGRLSLRAYVIGAEGIFMENLKSCVVGAGLPEPEFMVQIVAASYAVLDEEEMEEGTVVLDIGHSTTSMAFWYEGMLVGVRVKPFGGSRITERVAREFRLPKSTAEEVKKGFGAVGEDWVDFGGDEIITVADKKRGIERQIEKRRLVAVMDQAYTSILEDVRGVLEEMRVYTYSAGITVVLIGGHGLMPGVREITEDFLDLPVAVGRPMGEGVVEPAQDPRMAGAVGLAMMLARRGTKSPRRKLLRGFGEFLKEIFG